MLVRLENFENTRKNDSILLMSNLSNLQILVSQSAETVSNFQTRPRTLYNFGLRYES